MKFMVISINEAGSITETRWIDESVALLEYSSVIINPRIVYAELVDISRPNIDNVVARFDRFDKKVPGTWNIA